MFKSGEIAKIKGTNRTVVVLNGLSTVQTHTWPVETDGGIFEETELEPAHFTVAATAEGRFLAHEKSKNNKPGIDWDTLKELEGVFKKCEIDFNGHMKNGSVNGDKSRFFNEIFLSPHCMTQEEVEKVLEASKTGIPLTEWVSSKSRVFLDGLRNCYCCGEEIGYLQTNGIVLRIDEKPCEFPNGVPNTEWELNVPSGKIVVANDLRDLFPAEVDHFDVNIPKGRHQTTLAYAEHGISHAFVGNTCPGVYLCQDGSYKIANPPSDDKWDEEKQEYVLVKPRPKFEGKLRASICTDLWWYSICDYEDFQRRVKTLDEDARDFSEKIVKVKPGVYRFTHYGEVDENEDEVIYSKFEWVREPDPIKKPKEIVQINPHTFVKQKAEQYPTLYSTAEPLDERNTTKSWEEMNEEEKRLSWKKVADQIFCVTGGAIEWSADGCPLASIDNLLEDINPPSFRSQYYWYPFNTPYGGLFSNQKLSPSFAKYAFRTLESIVSFGTTVQIDYENRHLDQVRKRMLIAVERFRFLIQEHPEVADPEYVAWLSQEGRAESWVANFPLGPEANVKKEKS